MMEPNLREITFRDAIREALIEEMERQPGMIIIGEDLLPGGGSFGVHQGMAERSFADRIFEAPISEAAIVGTALGAAMTGGPAARRSPKSCIPISWRCAWTRSSTKRRRSAT